MATENKILDICKEAAEDLINDQYRFIVLDPSTGKVRRPDSKTDKAYGVLQNAPKAGEAAVIRVEGISKVEVNAALSIGDYVKPEYVSAEDAGKAQDASGELQCVRGVIVEAADAEDDLAAILLIGPVPSGIVISVPLPALAANSSVYAGILAVSRDLKVTKISIACQTKPVDDDGACTLKVENYDKSSGVEDNLLGAATFDLEGIGAVKEAEDIPLTETAADLILVAGDYIFATLTNDSAAIDTNMMGAVLTIEADIL